MTSRKPAAYINERACPLDNIVAAVLVVCREFRQGNRGQEREGGVVNRGSRIDVTR